MVDDPNRILVDYVKKNLAKGYTAESLRFALIDQGYSRTVIDKSLRMVNKELAEQAPKVIEQPEIKTEIIVEEPVVQKKSFWKRLFGLD
jgi:hypothetical protein